MTLRHRVFGAGAHWPPDHAAPAFDGFARVRPDLLQLAGKYRAAAARTRPNAPDTTLPLVFHWYSILAPMAYNKVIRNALVRQAANLKAKDAR